ncbi:MAG: hypothetical protein DHS20C13_25380 [Thermodesulfobacteriota bacterium]|nr:MAG: hypothetical protein DHS20C13_25380 [Thermodesulfobacteriota bacterium]
MDTDQVQKKTKTKDELIMELQQLRIKELEREIKRIDPDAAEMLGIDLGEK